MYINSGCHLFVRIKLNEYTILVFLSQGTDIKHVASMDLLQHFMGQIVGCRLDLYGMEIIHEKPIVLLSNQSVSDISIAKIVCSDVLSSMNPKTVIPALLFSKYVTARNKYFKFQI